MLHTARQAEDACLSHVISKEKTLLVIIGVNPKIFITSQQTAGICAGYSARLSTGMPRQQRMKRRWDEF